MPQTIELILVKSAKVEIKLTRRQQFKMVRVMLFKSKQIVLETSAGGTLHSGDTALHPNTTWKWEFLAEGQCEERDRKLLRKKYQDIVGFLVNQLTWFLEDMAERSPNSCGEG